LTKKQETVLEYISYHLHKFGYPPTVREIGRAFGISEKAAHDYLNAIEKKGYIRRAPGKPRAIEILDDVTKKGLKLAGEVPIVGRVAAGTPLLATENIEGTLPVPKEMIKHDSCFALRVKGSSMIDAGILEGDLVIVKSQSVADPGDIVVALLDDEATVKRLFFEGDKICLQPENPNMEAIVVSEVQVLGKVIGLFRQM
jgi:repressor LexA